MKEKLLIEEYPLLVLPSLAVQIGLNEAIILQQLHYWLKGSDKRKDGKKWIYNTYQEWNKQFPFWSMSTIRRTLTNLEKKELIITDNYNKMKADKTKWYTINYERLFNLSSPCVQNEQSMCSKWTDGAVQNEQSNTRDYTETTTETTTIPYVEIVDYLNKMADKKYRHTTSKTKNLIKARWNEGFRLEDFKKVIDIKTAEWKNDKKMSAYLRPETLFGTKFESYLNQETNIRDDQYSGLF